MVDSYSDNIRSDLRLLVVCLSHSWGGLEQVAAEDAIDLADDGFNVSVACLPESPIDQYLSKKEGIRRIPVPFRPRNFLDFKFKSFLENTISESKINLVHTHQTSLLGTLVPWLWSLRQVGLVASRHIISQHNKKNLFHRLLYSRVDFLIVMSLALKKNVLLTHPMKERSVKVVNLGLDFSRFDPDDVDATDRRKEWGADPDTVVIGMVGRIDPAKGQETFIKAASRLVMTQKENEKFKFVIVGEQTLGSTREYLKELQAMIDQFGLGKQIVFTGFQENIPEIMRSFDIFVMPSRQEAFGLVAIEAMAMECPIVISSGGSAYEIIGNEDFGLKVRPEDPYDLQIKIRYLLDHPTERLAMGRRARQHVQTHYDKRIRLKKTVDLYARVLRLRKRYSI